MIIHFENDLNGKRHCDRLEAERERGGFGGVHKKIECYCSIIST